MTITPTHALILHVLQNATSDRLKKAFTALNDHTLDITLTRQSEAEIRALVTNGDGISYGVAYSRVTRPLIPE